jgi:hypothetical protein
MSIDIIASVKGSSRQKCLLRRQLEGKGNHRLSKTPPLNGDAVLNKEGHAEGM